MKTLFALSMISIAFYCFGNRQTIPKEQIIARKEQEITDTTFRHIVDFPNIKDSAQFIADLKTTFHLLVDESSSLKENESITVFKKVHIYGSDQEYIFIEYDYKKGCGAAFPWKYQLLLTLEGRLVKVISSHCFEFVEIEEHAHPYLLTIIGTDKGNGTHELYKFSEDTLENCLEGYASQPLLNTYDAHEDDRTFEPHELTLKAADYNQDGHNDIAFYGNLVSNTEDQQITKTPIEFILIYDKKTGHFTCKEDYTKKYHLLE